MDASQNDRSTPGKPRRSPFNVELFAYEPAKEYAWQVFKHITVATVTWNRLEFTNRFIESVLQHSHLPYRLLIVDNASTDGSVEYLRRVAGTVPHVTLIENRSNKGLIRALQQIRDTVDDGLVVYCDNDMQVLTNYWLLLVMKAFHAVRLARGSSDAALGLRVINLDEYGFRYATDRQVLEIPGERNAEPRTSYAAADKGQADPSERLREQVVIGWTRFLMGGAQAMPAAVLRQLRLEDCYPSYIGNTDTFMTAELHRLGVPIGYIENGPVLRHNDWPYSDQKTKLYETLSTTRAVSDASYIRWKLRRILHPKR